MTNALGNGYGSPITAAKWRQNPEPLKKESVDSGPVVDVTLSALHEFLLNMQLPTFEECFAYLQAKHTWTLLDQPKFQNLFTRVVDKKGCSLLMRAIHSGCFSLAEQLIKGKIGLSTRDVKGNSCLHVAAKYGSVELIDKLRSHLDVNATNNKLHSPLCSAIKKRRPDVVQYLVDNGAHLDICFPYKNKSLTPLDFAKVIKAPQCVQILSKKKDQLERSIVTNFIFTKGLVEYQLADTLVNVRIATNILSIKFQIHKEDGHFIATMQSLAKGSFYFETDNFLEAGNQFSIAREYLICALGKQHSSVIALLCLIADCLYYQAKFKEACDKYIDLLELLIEKPKVLLRIKSDCLHTIASCYFMQKNYVKARYLYTNALKLFNKMPEDPCFDIPSCFVHIGLCYYNEQNYDEALYQFYEALNPTHQRSQESLYGRGKCFFFIGACYLMKENYVEARYQFHEALQCFTPKDEEASDITSTVRFIELCNKKIHGTGWFCGLGLTQVVALTSIACSHGFGEENI